MNMHIVQSRTIARRAMLCAVKIQMWSGRKLDREVTDETNRAHGAAADAGRFNKALVARDALADIVNVANRARKEHYARTLPWHDDGARILPATGYLDFTAAMRGLRGEFDAARAEFLAGYDAAREAAKARLNGMFKATDYPSADDIGRRFGFDIVIGPMPDAADFRVDVGDDAEADRIRADIQARTDAAIRGAMADAFNRVCDLAGKMAAKMAEVRRNEAGEIVSPIFRDSMVENLRELVAHLPHLNITGDADLARIADRVKAELCRHDADALRDDAGARLETAKAAESIAAEAKAAADALAHVADFMA